MGNEKPEKVQELCKVCDRPECKALEIWNARPRHRHRKATVVAACAPCQRFKTEIKACHGAAVDWRLRAKAQEAELAGLRQQLAKAQAELACGVAP